MSPLLWVSLRGCYHQFAAMDCSQLFDVLILAHRDVAVQEFGVPKSAAGACLLTCLRVQNVFFHALHALVDASSLAGHADIVDALGRNQGRARFKSFVGFRAVEPTPSCDVPERKWKRSRGIRGAHARPQALQTAHRSVE
eukprot:1073319-Pyramimonas_sp.AAC.1